MLRIETILGSATSAEFAGRLHDLAHAGRVETLRLPHPELARRRRAAVVSDAFPPLSRARAPLNPPQTL